jgi:hypothetical protein
MKMRGLIFGFSITRSIAVVRKGRRVENWLRQAGFAHDAHKDDEACGALVALLSSAS